MNKRKLTVKIIILFSIILASIFLIISVNSMHSISALTTFPNNKIPVTTTPRIIAVVIRPPLLFPNQTELVTLYKPHLTSTDYVITYVRKNLPYINMLAGIKTIAFNTLGQILKSTPLLAGTGISVIGYDLENGSSHADANDPVNSVKRASEVAHQNGFKFMLLPGGSINTPSLDAQYAKYADILVIQAEAHQQSPQLFQSFVTPRVDAARSANPKIPILIEVSVANRHGQVANIEQDFSSVANIVDGVHIWYKPAPGQLSMVDQFLRWIRSSR